MENPGQFLETRLRHYKTLIQSQETLCSSFWCHRMLERALTSEGIRGVCKGLGFMC